MKTKAALVTEKSGKFKISEVELAELRDDEVLVRVVGVGVCHTDLVCRDQLYPVRFPAVFGHEGAGVVEKVGARVTSLRPGDPVVMSYRACGQCRACRNGDMCHCAGIFENNFGGGRADGTATISQAGAPVFGNFFNQSSFATFALANEANTVKVPADLPLALLAPLGCGIQTGAGAVINVFRPPAGSSIAVFGCGAVGLAAIMAAAAVGCTSIVAIEPHQVRRDLAMELGATLALDPRRTEVVAELQQLGGMDYSLECTGLPAVFRQAVDCLTVPGFCAVAGAAPLGTEVTLDMNSIMFGRTVMGIVEGGAVPKNFIPKLIELYRQGRLPLEKIVRFYAFDDINQAVSDAETGTVVKAVLTF
jgi:aryl-alcohol dehydrogenase